MKLARYRRLARLAASRTQTAQQHMLEAMAQTAAARERVRRIRQDLREAEQWLERRLSQGLDAMQLNAIRAYRQQLAVELDKAIAAMQEAKQREHEARDRLLAAYKEEKAMKNMVQRLEHRRRQEQTQHQYQQTEELVTVRHGRIERG